MEHIDQKQSLPSCSSCRRLKKRCDRGFPSCAQCQRRELECDYTNYHEGKRRSRKKKNTEVVQLIGAYGITSPISKSSISTASWSKYCELSEITQSDLLAARFLDPALFQIGQLETPKVDVAITKTVADLVGNITGIKTAAEVFFRTVHVWMPILSKKQFYEILLHRLSHRKTELFLLTLSMKLVSSEAAEARTMLYQMVKQFYFEVESAGLLSLQVLQAAVLITAYELGHAIYPAAYLSVATCARIATTLGIDKSLTSNEMRIPWAELEEQRRIWWIIIILDRFLNLSNTARHLVTPDPIPESYLPVDDVAWNNGSSKLEDAMRYDSSSKYHIGRFARFVHTAPLISQALLHANGHDIDAAQLRRTILSLVNLSEIEDMMRKVIFCPLLAICYSCVFLLDPALSHTAENLLPLPSVLLLPETIMVLDHAIAIMTSFTADDTLPIGQMSPFLFHMIYNALTLCFRIKCNAPMELNIDHKIYILKLVLQQFSKRWLVAGTYLTLAKKQEILLQIRNL